MLRPSAFNACFSGENNLLFLPGVNMAIIDGDTMIGVYGRMALSVGAAWILWFSPAVAMAQPLDTMPGTTPAATPRAAPAPDALPLDTAVRSAIGTVEIVVDTVRPQPKPMVTQTVPLRVAQEDNRLFSLFDYGKIVAIGPSLSYFYYNEHVDINPLIQEYLNQHAYAPAIAGTPKSTEYGGVLGFNMTISRSISKPRLFVRTKFGMLFGIATTYDGSTQGDTTKTTGTITFSSVSDQKNNFFLSGGLDLGYVFSNMKCPWTVYTGIDAKVWYRDMTMYKQQSSGISMSEMYYWFSVPLGAVITKPVSPSLLLGVEPRVDLMFYGKMQVSMSGYGVSLDFPTLKLGNRASYRLDAFVQTRPGQSVSLRFGPYVMLYGFSQSNTDTVFQASYGGYPAQRAAFCEPASASFWIGFLFQVAFLRDCIIKEKGR
jgi:hypothetical protein